MMKNVIFGIAGFAIGTIVTLFILPGLLAEEMFIVSDSKYNFEETVEKIKMNAVNNGWKVPKIYDMQESLRPEGFEIENLNVISVCNPAYANRILSSDHRKKISSIMPCRVSVFETKKGEIKIARMNSAMMGKMFGDVTEDVMASVSKDTEEKLLKELIAD